MAIQIIDELYESGELRTLIHRGIVPLQILTYRKVFHLYNERIAAGRKKMEAMEDVSCVFGYSDKHIYHILKLMKD